MPRPQPDPEILKIKGTYRADRHGHLGKTVSYPVAAPKCPAWLSKEAKAEWKRVVKELLAAGVLAEVDRAVLAAYCSAWDEFQVANKKLAELGHTAKGSTGQPTLSPWVKLRNLAGASMLKLGKELGLTPHARRGLKTGQEDEPAENPKAKFFKGDKKPG